MKVAIYVRLSDEDKNKQHANDESESIQNQKSMLLNYALDKEWDVYKIYCDEDYSGADRMRPEFNALISDAKAKKFNIVLCKSQSRFSRDMEHIEKYLHNDFLEWGVRFISLVDNADTNDRHNKKSRQINGLVNEWYLEDISDNIKMVFKNKHREGKSTRSFMPYGYKKADDDRNKIEVDEEAAAVVKRIFESYVSGVTTSGICEMLNSEGVLSPYSYKQSKGIKLSLPHAVKVQIWQPQSITRILHNQMYLGDLVHNICKKVSYKSKKILLQPKENWTIIPNTHKAIIEREMYDKAQQMLNMRYKSTKKEGKPHIFAKKVVCAECGTGMHKVNSHYKDREYSYLRCHFYKEHAKIKLDVLENIVSDRLREYFREVNSSEVADELTIRKDDTEILKSELSRIETSLCKQKEYLKSIYQDKVNGLIDDNEFIDLKNDFTEEQTRLKQRQASLNAQIIAIVEKQNRQVDKVALVEKFINFPKLERNIVDEFIDQIKIGIVANKSQEITIDWAI